jgi:hypothetical protein
MQIRNKAALAVTAILACALGWLWASSSDEPSSVHAEKATSVSMTGQGASPFDAASAKLSSGSTAPLSPEGQRERETKLIQAQKRYDRAEFTYNSYRDATRYPFESRPISEHPDRVRPFEPAVEEKTLRSARGEAVKGITLKTGQDHVFLSGTDAVKFTVQALDDQGKAIPLVITRASAQSIPNSKQLAQQRTVALEFSDAGPTATNGVDQSANDGQYSARFEPLGQGFTAANGFAGGTIRVLVFVNANGKEGVAHFDVIYTEDTPASWVQGASGIREAQEAGSLNFYVKANVRVAGRYVVTARVDDARGQPFALVSFNEEVKAGAQEFKLQLFGALVRDKRPTFPLKLRDMDGFLLIPDKFPDRLMMARRPAVVYTSGSYSAESFSPDEWSSEERTRYLAEFGRDLDATRRELERLGGK